MKIAIVEDDKMDMARLRQIVEAKLQEREDDSTVQCFSSGEDFLRAFSPGKYGLIFLDNYIGGTLGINLAQKVRAMDPRTALVFVSMSAEFAISGFEVQALHYLIKPVTPDEIDKVFDRLRNTTAPLPQSIDLVSEYQSMTVPIDSINYIEVLDKACMIHGADFDFKSYLSLEKLLALLPEERFLRTHRSYVVNLSSIRRMAATNFTLKNDDKIPIGRAYQNECKKTYMQYLAAK
ncbi:MAG: response regulator transcription factor [Schwartzia sp.]|nr:response regulator transcription factor [Schwartzia sp. (in: firmicutes)]